MALKPGLALHIALRRLLAPAASRKLAAEIASGGPEKARLAERLGQPGLRRPEGPLVWLHAAGAGAEATLRDLAAQIAPAEPEASFLLTSDDPAPAATPEEVRMLHQLAPLETPQAVEAFLAHWQPDVGFWSGTDLRPVLIDAAARRGLRLCLVAPGSGTQATRGWQRWTGIGPAALSRFSHAFAGDDAAAAALVAAGAVPASVEIVGPPAEEAVALPCSLRERDAIGTVLQARPVWLAAGVPQLEERAVHAAQRAAARLAHRLLLILVPSEPARGPALAAKLAAAGCQVALRSVEGEPDSSTEVFVADVEGELGLWYRLAPVCYMGGTLTGEAGGGRSPLEPAALGSAILHGPATAAHAATYARFASVGAAREVADAVALGSALSDLLSPDRAATMAHAAWQVSIGGPDLAERVRAVVAGALRGGER